MTILFFAKPALFCKMGKQLWTKLTTQKVESVEKEPIFWTFLLDVQVFEICLFTESI